MHRRLLLSRVIHRDDTGVKLRAPGCDRTKKAHLWAGIGDADYPYVVFDFTADYTATGPTRFLAGYAGYFQADALAPYEGLYGEGRVKHVCCLAHARHKFVAAVESGDGRANTALEFIRQLYAIERELPPLLAPADDPAAAEQRRQREEQRRRTRQREATPVLAALKAWLDQTRPAALHTHPNRDVIRRGVTEHQKGGGTGGKPDEQLEPLSAILKLLNDRFGTTIQEEDKQFLETLEEKLDSDPGMAASFAVNTRENARLTFDHKVRDHVQDMIVTNFKFFKQINDKPDFADFLNDLLFDRYAERREVGSDSTD